MEKLISKLTLIFVSLVSFVAPRVISASEEGRTPVNTSMACATMSSRYPQFMGQNDVTPYVPFEGKENQDRRYRLELLRQQGLRDIERIKKSVKANLTIPSEGLVQLKNQDGRPTMIVSPDLQPTIQFLCSDAWPGVGRSIGGLESLEKFLDIFGEARTKDKILLNDPKDVNISESLACSRSEDETRGAVGVKFGRFFWKRQHESQVLVLNNHYCKLLDDARAEKDSGDIDDKDLEKPDSRQQCRNDIEKLIAEREHTSKRLKALQNLDCEILTAFISKNVALARGRLLGRRNERYLGAFGSQQAVDEIGFDSGVFNANDNIKTIHGLCDELYPGWRTQVLSGD